MMLYPSFCKRALIFYRNLLPQYLGIFLLGDRVATSLSFAVSLGRVQHTLDPECYPPPFKIVEVSSNTISILGFVE